jgi:imidazolonepropionase-like amidohydrolase
MNRFKFLLAVTTVALGLATAASAETIAVIGAKLYPVSVKGPIENGTVVIRDGKVVAMGAGLAPPAGARVIDAKGAVVTPGLMNAATHLGLLEVNSLPETVDDSVGSGPLGAAFDVQYGLNPNSTLIPLARADGLTRAASYPSGASQAPFAGMAAVLRLSEDGDILDRPKAAMVLSATGVAAEGVGGGSRSGEWVLVRNALSEARRYNAGPKSLAPRDQLLNHLDAEALQPVLDGRAPLAVFVNREADIRQAVRLADDFKIRVIIFGGTEAWRAADLLAARKIAVVVDPTENLPMSFDQIGARLDNAALLQRAGVTVAFSVGSVHITHNAGSQIREVAGLAVANGLPWDEGLKAITVNAARIWGIDDHYGTLAPGQDGDLVIWDGDPLEPTSATRTVLVRGQVASMATRQSALRDRYNPARRGEALPPGYR